MRAPRRLSCWTLVAAAVVLALPQSVLAAHKVLRLRFDGPVNEAPSDDGDLAVLFGGSKPKTLYQWVHEIQQAKDDADISAIAMIIEQPQMGIAQIEEITQALKQFRDAGKKVYCFMEYAGNGQYALACAADHIMLAENSELAIMGLHAEMSYYRGLLDKLGIVPQMLQCGDYKSAFEPFMRTGPSEPARENINWLLDGIFERWIELIAQGRGISVDDVHKAVDSAPISAEKAKADKLVDSVASFSDFRKLIKREYGKDVEVVKSMEAKDELNLDPSNPFAMLQFFSELLGEEKVTEKKPGIGLIYIEGPIVTGTNKGGPFGGKSAASATIRAAFEAALADDAIKAIVVRVDSPGGSALASDIMWKAEVACAAEKPLIVSMGGVAGSGGYYVSIPAQTIFANASTITASIGVIGGKFVWDGMWDGKLGITTHEFNRGAHAGIMSFNRAWTPEEQAFLTDWINGVYDQFKGRIMTSRGDRLKGNLDDMDGGRVYTGRQALERGLVDRIGTLSDALAFAADKIGVADYEVYMLPKPKEPMDILKKLITGEEDHDEWEITGTPGFSHALNLGGANDTLLRAFAPLLKEMTPAQVESLGLAVQNMMILNSEHAGCLMPFDIQVK